MAATLSVSFTPPQTSSANHVVVWASRALSPGVGATPDLYFMTRGQGSAITPLSSLNFLTAWQARFGAPIGGTKIMVGVQIIRSNGLKSKMITRFVTVTP